MACEWACYIRNPREEATVFWHPSWLPGKRRPSELDPAENQAAANINHDHFLAVLSVQMQCHAVTVHDQLADLRSSSHGKRDLFDLGLARRRARMCQPVSDN